jgi:hypothetical protein
MRRIIADTNIWYEIEKAEVIKLYRNNFQIVVPIIVLNELYTSPKIHLSEISFSKLKKAITAILDNLEYIEFIDLGPFEYLVREISPDIKPKIDHDFFIREFKALIKLDYNAVKDNHTVRADISGLTNFINETSIAYGKEINKHQGTKDKFVTFSTLQKTEELILKYTNENLEVSGKYPKLIKLNPDNILLASIFDNLLRTASKVGNKFENNDWVDIFILSYVGKNDLYWTNERSKLKAFKNLNYESQLFIPA